MAATGGSKKSSCAWARDASGRRCGLACEMPSRRLGFRGRTDASSGNWENPARIRPRDQCPSASMPPTTSRHQESSAPRPPASPSGRTPRRLTARAGAPSPRDVAEIDRRGRRRPRSGRRPHRRKSGPQGGFPVARVGEANQVPGPRRHREKPPIPGRPHKQLRTRSVMTTCSAANTAPRKSHSWHSICQSNAPEISGAVEGKR